MNRKEWKELCNVSKSKAYYWYNKVHKILKSKEFELLENCDKDAKVIHHLRDTEEQRKYNDEHYELFGFEVDENGKEHFEYGKYVVFWTKEHHTEYHKCSEETKAKRSISLKKAYENPELREKCSRVHKGIKHNEETKLKISVANKGKQYFGDKNPFYGKHHTEEVRKKMSESHKGMFAGENHPFYGKHHTEESCKKISNSLKDKPSPFKGKHHSAEAIEMTRSKNIDSKNKIKQLYVAYKNNGGILKWNDFQKIVKDGTSFGSLIPFYVKYNDDGTLKELVPQIEEIKEKDIHPSDTINEYVPEATEDTYDYMQ